MKSLNVLRGKRKSQRNNSIKLIGGDMREKGLIGKRCEREKVCVIEGIIGGIGWEQNF